MVSGKLTLLSVLNFLAVSNAHIFLGGKGTIKPFPLVGDNGPLNAGNFPCKVQEYDRSKVSNKLTVGQKASVGFTGSAVHGGGSCQIAVTKDLKPNKDTKWQVIHSIHGGCPARNAAGNVPGGTSDVYEFTIPEGIEGEGTMAWTWINKVGNREFYMECAPISVSGKAKRSIEKRMEAQRLSKRNGGFPDIWVPNLCKECTTVEGKDYAYTNPGPSVETNSKDLTPQPKCGCFGHDGSLPSGSAPKAPGSGPTTAPKDAPKPEAPKDAPKDAPKPEAPKDAPKDAPKPEAPKDAPKNAPANTSAPSSGGSGGALECAADGKSFVLVGDARKQSQQVAAGTACKDGKIVAA